MLYVSTGSLKDWKAWRISSARLWSNEAEASWASEGTKSVVAVATTLAEDGINTPPSNVHGRRVTESLGAQKFNELTPLSWPLFIEGGFSVTSSHGYITRRNKNI